MTTLARCAHSSVWQRATLALSLFGSHGALAATSCPPTVVEGVDVSAGQGLVVWSSVQASGRGFAYAQATQGNTLTDSRFGNNWPAMKTAGLLRGAIHFFDPTVDGVTQANYFLSAISAAGGLDKNTDLPATLDLECPTSSLQGSADPNCVAPGNSGWVANGTLVQRVFDWLTTVQNATGKQPVIYTYPAWYSDVGFADLRLARYPVYIASYAACADVPAPWAAATFWQYSQTGSVPGIAGNATDLDRYVGSAAQLQRLVERLFTHGFEGLTQVITFTSSTPVAPKFGGTYNVTATTNSSLPITLGIDASASSVCSIGGSTVSFIGVGTCAINANQAGDATWSAAAQAQQSFAVAKADQSLAFNSAAPGDAQIGGAVYVPSATATSGLPVAFSIDASASSVCSLSAGNVSFLGAGSCVINANQAGNANFNAATQVQQSFSVNKRSQAISFTTAPPGNVHIGDPVYTPTATATSGLPVTLTIDASATSVCSISAGDVSFIGIGTCVINANQAGDATYNAAPQAQQSIAVAGLAQTISFTSTPPGSAHQDGPTYLATATATSGLPVTLTIDASAASVCSIAADSVSFITGGTCVINANQAGDTTYSAAPQAQQSFAVIPCFTLALGQVVKTDMPDGASLCINNPTGSAAEYTYLPINLSTTVVYSLSLLPNGIQAVSGPPNPQPAGGGEVSLAPLQEALTGMAASVHGIQTPAAFPTSHTVSKSDLISPHGVATTPLTVGQLINLNASVGNCATTPDIRKARVEAITTPQSAGQLVLYAVQEVVETTAGANDWHPPVIGGYTAPMLQSVIDAIVQAPPGTTTDPDGAGGLSGLLKTGFLDTATANFGAQTDLDDNGGLIVFFTPAINALSPAASSAVVQAMFQPRDMYDATSCPGSNQGEILYMMVPDPTGVINSNVRTLSAVYGGAPVAIVHFYEHLLSAWRRTYAVAGPGSVEAMWLDEALAWQGQELAFWNASVGLGPRGNVQLSTLTTGPNASVRVNDFNTYENSMFGHERTWFFQLTSTNGFKRMGPVQQTPISTGTSPTVHENAAPNFAIGYTFLRYMLDRQNTGDAALLYSLVNSGNTGLTNLQTVFGQPSINDWLRDFLVAIYTDDAVSGVAAQYTMPSWNLRSVYGGLGGYPLAVDALSNNVSFNFNLNTGGGTRYARFGIAGGSFATLALTEAGSPPSAQITTALVRTK